VREKEKQPPRAPFALFPGGPRDFLAAAWERTVEQKLLVSRESRKCRDSKIARLETPSGRGLASTR